MYEQEVGVSSNVGLRLSRRLAAQRLKKRNIRPVFLEVAQTVPSPWSLVLKSNKELYLVCTPENVGTKCSQSSTSLLVQDLGARV